MRPRLLALDLDGTLMTYDNRLPVGHARAVQEIRRMGVSVAICTGRSLKTSRWVWEELGLTMPMVCFNGAWVGIPDCQPIAQATIHEADAQEIVQELSHRAGAICCYPNPTTWIMNHHLPRTLGWSDLYGIEIHIQPEAIAAWRGSTFKVMYVDEPHIVSEVAHLLSLRFGQRFQVQISQEDRVEILPREVNKGWGLQRLAKHVGIAQADIWAVGDAENDRDMLLWAGHPCVMGQASEQLLDIAQFRLPSIEALGLCALVPIIERALAEDV